MRILRAEIVDGTLEVTPIDGPLQSIPLVEAIAAPELLAACERIIGTSACGECAEQGRAPCVYCQARTAIAKAREEK
jgi:hypothetical protein